MNRQTHLSLNLFRLATLGVILLANLTACDLVSPGSEQDVGPQADAKEQLTDSHMGAQMGHPVLFSGFRHFPEGAAILNPGAGDLTVSNIGSSGLDGVLVDVDEYAQGAVNGFEPIPLREMGLNWSTRLTFDGSDVGLRIVLQRGIGGIDLSIDGTGLGGAGLEVELRDKGQPVKSKDIPTFGPTYLQIEGDAHLIACSVIGSRVSDAIVSASLQFSSPVVVHSPNGASMMADEIQVHVESETGPALPRRVGAGVSLHPDTWLPGL